MSNQNLLENYNHHTENRSFSLHRTEVNVSYTNALYVHYHPEMEFLFMEKGDMVFYAEGRKYDLHKGDAIFLPPYTVHSATKTSETECIYSAIVFASEWLWGNSTLANNDYTQAIHTNRYDCITVLRADDTRNTEILASIGSFHKYRNASVETYELTLRGQLLICFQELYISYFSKLATNGETASTAHEIQKVLNYISEHFREEITLAQLSALCGYSPSHFEHTFKSITGSSPFEHIMRIRIINASEALKNTDKKITDIAVSCGYSNISYFNRSFKKIMGTSPKEFRKSLQ